MNIEDIQDFIYEKEENGICPLTIFKSRYDYTKEPTKKEDKSQVIKS